jgi:hypothetical protein
MGFFAISEAHPTHPSCVLGGFSAWANGLGLKEENNIPIRIPQDRGQRYEIRSSVHSFDEQIPEGLDDRTAIFFAISLLYLSSLEQSLNNSDSYSVDRLRSC